MAIDKLRRIRFMAVSADLATGNLGQGSIVRTMRIMTGGAILRCGRVECTVTPVLCHFTVTAKTKSRLALDLVSSVKCTVATVTSNTLPLQHRFMLKLVPSRFGCHLFMTVQTNFSWLTFEKFILVGTMGDMT
jgi:hypothetical protein